MTWITTRALALALIVLAADATASAHLLAQSGESPPILIVGNGPQLTFDCGTIDAALLTRVGGTRTLCPFGAQGQRFASEGIGGNVLLIALNPAGAMVAIHEPGSGATDAFEGTIDHVGSADQTVYWGLWHTGTILSADGQTGKIGDDNAIPYIAGVTAHSVASSDRVHCRTSPAAATLPVCSSKARFLSDLPTDGSATYTLAGQAGVVSTRDDAGNVVPIGTITRGHAVVDFAHSTVQLELTVEVRGTTEQMSFPMTVRSERYTLADGVEATLACQDAPQEWCPHAEAHFYGRDGSLIGVNLLYAHTAVLPQPVWVAAHLANVDAQGALVLRRQ
jgi:hypothetical protein